MNSIDPSNHPSFPVPDEADHADDAANLIRAKLDSIYSDEPDAVGEAIESEQTPTKKRSKHQKFMAELAESGKPFAQIQTEWHEYYVSLPDKDKHEVWNEFYENQSKQTKFKVQAAESLPLPELKPDGQVGEFEPPEDMKKKSKASTIADVKKQLNKKVATRNKLSRKQHLKSLGFGLSMGLLTIAIMMFGLFNEKIIAPFITPSKNVSATPLILTADDAVGKESRLIIPKINIELPVIFDIKTIDEASIQRGLENGVVHYATTSNPGEEGNGALFGHSSNNILNNGKYKFAFTLLHRLEEGDVFYVEHKGVRYSYRIFQRKIVQPTDVSVLNDVPGKISTMTLITCDPPGSSARRLIVWGEQISPNPHNNTKSTAIKTDDQPEILASNPESLWSRIWHWVF